MKLTQEFITKLDEHIANKLINVQYHPTLPLRIFKYSREAQYNCKFNLEDYKDFKESDLREWDEVLLTCRGLIVDEDYNIIAKGFNKFFNYEELPQQELESRQHMKPTIYEKADGSLGILFYYGDSWHIATQGSFTSEQAKLAMNILQDKYAHLHLNFEYTYLVEIVSPLNRIVVHYEKSDLTYSTRIPPSSISGG